ncbi:MAG TPA: HU family DNA-binding protein [bacterium]|nr:HU family DNA-binding protein [bacterium]
MTKAELTAKMAKDAKITNRAAEEALNSLLNSIKASLKRGKPVTMVGFGTFSVAKRKARTGRNPQTGKAIHIAARKVPRFKAGKGLKDTVR